MNSKKAESPASEPVHPFDAIKPEWEVSRKSVKMNDLLVRHDIQPPDEISIPSMSHHLLLINLSHGDNQTTHIEDCKHEGEFAVGEFFLQPVTCSAFYAWKTTDETVLFVLEPTFLHRIAEESECLNADKIELRPIACQKDAKIEHIARCFQEEMQTAGLGGSLYSETLATQLAIHLLRNYCIAQPKFREYKGGLSPSKLQAVIDYIQANLETNMRLDDVARTVNTSTWHFCRMFKQATGVTPFQYVVQQRLELGKQLLRQEETAIVEIALMCGFGSQSAFNKAFKNYTGVTPKTYRQRL